MYFVVGSNILKRIMDTSQHFSVRWYLLETSLTNNWKGLYSITIIITYLITFSDAYICKIFELFIYVGVMSPSLDYWIFEREFDRATD